VVGLSSFMGSKLPS